MPNSRQKEFKAFVKRTLFQKGHSETEKLSRAKLAAMQRDTGRAALDAVEALHLFIHGARDNAIEYMAEYQKRVRELVGNSITFVEYQAHIQQAYRTYLRNTLQNMVAVFEALLGRKRALWAAIRIIEEKQGVRAYRTMMRCGKVSTDREQHSVPIPEDKGLPSYLPEQYSKGKGIVILNDSRPSKAWHPTKNDERYDDRSIMAGPVMVKSPPTGDSPAKKEMYMILYINSAEKNLFNENHEQFMRCCTDVLSMFFSMALTTVRDGVASSHAAARAEAPDRGVA